MKHIKEIDRIENEARGVMDEVNAQELINLAIQTALDTRHSLGIYDDSELDTSALVRLAVNASKADEEEIKKAIRSFK